MFPHVSMALMGLWAHPELITVITRGSADWFKLIKSTCRAKGIPT